jgi:hypothetical protein
VSGRVAAAGGRGGISRREGALVAASILAAGALGHLALDRLQRRAEEEVWRAAPAKPDEREDWLRAAADAQRVEADRRNLAAQRKELEVLNAARRDQSRELERERRRLGPAGGAAAVFELAGRSGLRARTCSYRAPHGAGGGAWALAPGRRRVELGLAGGWPAMRAFLAGLDGLPRLALLRRFDLRRVDAAGAQLEATVELQR